jgi:UDP-N-acetylmuramate: L-alanyl-gamma-D-glutamyl-meso-diaminopimelate ligase
MSTFLEKKGVKIFEGFDPNHVDYGPDLVIVGNAVRMENPEAQRSRDLDLNFCSMPQAINRFMAKGKKTILIAGTHGKTTTSSIAAWVLQKAGMDPSFFVGGILKNFNSNYGLGKGDFIVIEGDEYDTAYFDKGPKFLHFDPYITILTGVEFDHADIFKDIDHVTNAFESLINNISEKNSLIAYDNNDITDKIVSKARCSVKRYGKDKDSDWRIGTITIKPPWTVFEVFYKEKLYESFKTILVGQHNICNLLSVIAAAHILYIPVPLVKQAVETFAGVKRRQEVRGVKRGITVMDDFAHHPTAVLETIRAIKPFYPEGRLIAVFEPRTNTSMRNVFQNVYPDSFDDADIICIRKPPLLNKIPEDQRFSSEKLVDDLKTRNKEAYYFDETDTIIEFLLTTSKTNDLILIMSNGGFDNIHERLLERL